MDAHGQVSFPARNVYDCASVPYCAQRHGSSIHPYDYALGEITAEIAPQISACRQEWQGDGECDVPLNCPEGTDLADCGHLDSYDTTERQASRTVTFPRRTILDGGRPRRIQAARLMSNHLRVGAQNLVMIGYPNGLPRKCEKYFYFWLMCEVGLDKGRKRGPQAGRHESAHAYSQPCVCPRHQMCLICVCFDSFCIENMATTLQTPVAHILIR